MPGALPARTPAATPTWSRGTTRGQRDCGAGAGPRRTRECRGSQAPGTCHRCTCVPAGPRCNCLPAAAATDTASRRTATACSHLHAAAVLAAVLAAALGPAAPAPASASPWLSSSPGELRPEAREALRVRWPAALGGRRRPSHCSTAPPSRAAPAGQTRAAACC